MGRRLTRFQQKKLDAAFARADREAALRAQDGRCAYCLTPLTYKSVTREHRVPRSAGGSDNRENIAASCAPCNKLKGSLPEKQFKRLIHEPRRGEPIAHRLVWVDYRLNLALMRLERNIKRRMGIGQ